MEQKIVIYTDGSCLKNPEGPGGCCCVLRYQKSGRLYEKVKASPESSTTNNRMELTAIIKGLELIPEGSKEIEVHTDSQYVANAFNKGWLNNWIRINWDRGERGGPVKNADLWKELIEKKKELSIRFVWVKGHAGNELNELCDRMAVQAAKEQKTAYREGFVKAYSAAPKMESPSTIKHENMEYSSFDFNKTLAQKKSFLIFPFAAFDASTKCGEATVYLFYEGYTKVLKESYEGVGSTNETALLGIVAAVKSVRYREKKICIYTTTALGFSNPKKSKNKELIAEIIKAGENVSAEIFITEIRNSQKKLRRELDKKYQ